MPGPIFSETQRLIRFSPGVTFCKSEARASLANDPLNAKHNLVSFGPVLRAEFVVRIRIQEESLRCPHSARADCAHLLGRIRDAHAVDPRCGHLLQEVAVCANPE